MSARGAALAALMMLAAAAASHAQQPCLEPSALDLDPAAPPLRVAKDPSGDLALSWQDVGATAYHVHEGGVLAFDAPASYDHVVAVDATAPSVLLAAQPGDRYFLVNAECGYGPGSAGRDSFGRERPPGGRVLVTVGIDGGGGIFAALAGLGHPAWAFLADSDVIFLGPLAAGSPGDPLSMIGNDPAGVVTAAATFQIFDPDPAFTPGAGPTPFASFLFTCHGSTPVPADIPLVECDVRDALAEPVPGATCVVTGFVLQR